MALFFMLLLLSLLIIVHELGHFLAARAFGIKVDKFGFGLPMGPTLFKTKWGETEILIHALLLGGYVSFPDDDEKNELPKDSELRFANKPIYQRAIVIAAGVFFNILCAILIVFMASMIWHKLPSGKVDIFVSKIVAPKEASINHSGIKPEDRIYKVNNAFISTTGAINMFAFYSRKFDGKVSSEILNSKIAELKKLNSIADENKVLPVGKIIMLTPFTDEKAVELNYNQLIGIEKYKLKELKLTEDQIKLRDEISGKKKIKVTGVVTLRDIAFANSDTQRPITIVVERGRNIIKLNTVYSNDKGIIGLENKAEEIFYPTQTITDAVKYTTKYVYTNTKMMIVGLAKLFTGQVPLNDLHGIVVITKIGTNIIEAGGMFKGLLLAAIISLNLAIVNLLPLPALDGGHLLFLFIEKIKGRPINEKLLEKITSIGFNLLLLLMFYIIFNDIYALITKRF